MPDYTATAVVKEILVTDKAPSGTDNQSLQNQYPQGQYPQNGQSNSQYPQNGQPNSQYPNGGVDTNGQPIRNANQPAGTLPGFEFEITFANGDVKIFRTPAAAKDVAKNQVVAELNAAIVAVQAS